LPGELLLVFSADEEGGSTYGGKYLANDYGLRADAAIVCEPTGISQPWEFIAPVARGISCFKIKVKGTQMHSSLSDQLPSVNASVKMAGVLERMSRELEIQAPSHPLCPDGITVNLGVMLRGGVTYGVYPGYAEFAVDIRTIPGMTQAGVERDVEAFLDKLRRDDPQLDVELAFEPLPVGWTPPCEVPVNSPVVQAAQDAASQVLGKALPLRALPAVTDGAHFSAVGIDTIPAFGPGLLPLAHNANEYIDVENLGQAAQIYALTALNFFQRNKVAEAER
jgi:acetylornithine deacetylase